MKLNPFRRQTSSANQDSSDLVNYDESVLQQGRFWMKTVTWTLIGTTVFGVAWLALARTEEIVVAPANWNRWVPCRTSRCPWVVSLTKSLLRKAMP